MIRECLPTGSYEVDTSRRPVRWWAARRDGATYRGCAATPGLAVECALYVLALLERRHHDTMEDS